MGSEQPFVFFGSKGLCFELRRIHDRNASCRLSLRAGAGEKSSFMRSSNYCNQASLQFCDKAGTCVTLPSHQPWSLYFSAIRQDSSNLLFQEVYYNVSAKANFPRRHRYSFV